MFKLILGIENGLNKKTDILPKLQNLKSKTKIIIFRFSILNLSQDGGSLGNRI